MRPRGKRRTQPESLGALVPLLLDDLGFESTRVLTRIVEEWEAVVGRDVAQHARPAAIRGKVLEIETDASVWVQTLRLRAPELLGRLATALGTEAPRELWIRIGNPVQER